MQRSLSIVHKFSAWSYRSCTAISDTRGSLQNFETYVPSWVTTKRDVTRLEAAEMRFLRSVKGYTRLDKIRSEVIRKELEISGIQDVRLKYNKTGSTILKEWTTPDSRNTPSTTNLEE